MRALITGINGFVGGYLAEHLIAAGEWELFGLSRQPQLQLPHLRVHATYLTADLMQGDGIMAILARSQPDVIFHLAAQSNVHRSFDDPDGTLHANIFPEVYLFQALLQLNRSPLIIVVGSNEIYGQVRPDEIPVDEQTPLRPVSPY